ncbi:hypothetical protein EW146_g3224 [Bondarzewia mesenterica]|uniref:Uncharacterized protein n=1 Tax=Bondarzewia mesenterica TaxID=1095465 RepID=A0A4S4LY74_9AGAM|nr:hypothetical protein EW146_g3224 [Bondarzewia mesenterica]
MNTLNCSGRSSLKITTRTSSYQGPEDEKLRSETKSPPPDIALINGEKSATRGVHRISLPADFGTLLLGGQAYHNCIRSAVLRAAQHLASQGRMVDPERKIQVLRSGDGITIEWLLDFSVRDRPLSYQFDGNIEYIFYEKIPPLRDPVVPPACIELDEFAHEGTADPSGSHNDKGIDTSSVVPSSAHHVTSDAPVCNSPAGINVDVDGEVDMIVSSDDEHQGDIVSHVEHNDVGSVQGDRNSVAHLDEEREEHPQRKHSPALSDKSTHDSFDTSSDESSESEEWEDFGRHEQKILNRETATRQSPSSLTKRTRPTVQRSSANPPKRAKIDPSSSVSPDQIVPMPRGRFARARRLLAPSDPSAPMMAVSLRSELQFIHRPNPSKPYYFKISEYSQPAEPEDINVRNVQDAIIIQNTAIVGYAFNGDTHGPSQISLVPPIKTARKPWRIDLDVQAHSMVRESNGLARRNRGITALASIDGGDSEFRFASGGYDGFVYLWSVKSQGTGYHARCPQKLNKIEHTGEVVALAYHPINRSLLSAAGKKISTSMLQSPGRTSTVKMSNRVFHIHVSADDPNVILLEIEHLNRQVQIYDLRQSGLDREPPISFGYRCYNEYDDKADYRHARGSGYLSYFARGYRNGMVRLWDFRSPQKPVMKLAGVVQDSKPVAHTIFSGLDVVAYSANSVAIFDRNSKRSIY